MDGVPDRQPDPCAIVIFGSSGDLARRKLIPALFALERRGSLPENSVMAGFSRSDASDASLREGACASATDVCAPESLDMAAWNRFASGLYACPGDYADPESYRKLKSMLERLDREHGLKGNRLFYLAVPAEAHTGIIHMLAASGLAPRGSGRFPAGWSRVIIEKPFGRDLPSAVALNRELAEHLDEDMTYRIDHYLGKETVQNIIVFRFGNGIFEPLWNRTHIDHVQINVAESFGIGRRGKFYEETGALRDMVQNHLLQLLAIVAMEPPGSLSANDIRDEKVKVFRAIRPLTPADVDRDVVRGQYGGGIIGGTAVPGYRAERAVGPASGVETYAAMRLMIDNSRWTGVPFYLRTGKRLPRTATEIFIRFARIPLQLFKNLPAESRQTNELVLRIQPDEGISLSFGAKLPGSGLEIRPVNMDFSYAGSFGAKPVPAYERLLLDAIKGDASLFIRADGVEATWSVVQPILDRWAASSAPVFPNYAAGSWGPVEADELLARQACRWCNRT